MLGRRVALVALLAAVVAGASFAAPSAPGRLAVLAEREHMVTLAPAAGRDGRVGRLTLLVRNESPARVQLRVLFFADGGDGPVRLKPASDAAFPKDKPALYTNRSNLASGRLEILPGHTALVPLRFGLAKTAKAEVLNGIVVLAAQAQPNVQSAAVRVTGNVLSAPGASASNTTTKVKATLLQKLGAGGFGALLGWLLYFTNRYRKEVQLSDLGTIAGVIGGAAILTLFPAKTDLFGAYGVGLFVGFFAYFAFLLAFVNQSPNFSIDWFLDGRRKAPSRGHVIPPGTAESGQSFHPMAGSGGEVDDHGG